MSDPFVPAVQITRAVVPSAVASSVPTLRREPTKIGLVLAGMCHL
jgi:hypothetical protein